MSRKLSDTRGMWNRKSRLGKLMVASLSLLLSYSLLGWTLDETYGRMWDVYALELVVDRKVLPLAEEGAIDPGLIFGEDGLIHGWGERDNSVPQGKHPIEVLIETGEKRWRDLLSRQSQRLDLAVAEYQRRYGRAPPKGFDTWWRFCEENDVKIRDDYDQIDRDISPYFALSPETFRARADRLFKTGHSYHVHLSPTSTSITGDRATSARGRLLLRLLAPLAPLLPSNLTLHVSDHDLGSWTLADDQRRFLDQELRASRYVSEEELKPFEKREGRVKVKGLLSACPEDSPGWSMGLDKLEGRETNVSTPTETSFIHDPRLTYDFCTSLSLLQTHGAFSFDYPRESTLRPIFQLSKFSRNPEFLTTPLEAYQNLTDPQALAKYVPWEDKTVDKLFWRGSTTGDSYSTQRNWRKSHRARLGLMTQITGADASHSSTAPVSSVGESVSMGDEDTSGRISRDAAEMQRTVWVQRKGWRLEDWHLGLLNDRYMDVGLTGGPHQCNEHDGTCEEMRTEIRWKDRVKPEDAAKFKYVLDVDGNGWSSRFHRLLTSGSVVVKATIYPEWNSDWLIPWYHYIPTSVDYSDLYSIMSFFIGPPDTPTPSSESTPIDNRRREPQSGWQQGRFGLAGQDGHPIAPVQEIGHDNLARQIAKNGRAFGEQFWRWEDMQAYMLRLLLEYARLEADDRDAWSYMP